MFLFDPRPKKVVAARLQAGSRLIHTEPECCPTASRHGGTGVCLCAQFVCRIEQKFKKKSADE